MFCLQYRDRVEFIKLHQVEQGVSVRKLAERVGTSPQVITDIRGYRLKVSDKMFDSITKELGITNLSDTERRFLLDNQTIAKENKHRKYIKKKQKKNK